MDSQDDAYSAVKALDNAFFAGSTIKVEVSIVEVLIIADNVLIKE